MISSKSYFDEMGTPNVFDDLEYMGMEKREHVLERPSMYIGCVTKIPRQEWMFDVEANKFFMKETTVPKALTHLFVEILMNAADNVLESRKKGLDPGIIEVDVDETTTLIRNGGRPIPITLHEKYGVYNPEFVFGNLLSSSHYGKTKKRYSCGTNGLGAKCVNIWSKRFQVRVWDSFNGKRFKGVWRNNMLDAPEVEVKDYSKDINSVEVEWVADFERFEYTEYPEDVFKIFPAILLGVSLACKIPVSFNGKMYDLSNVFDFCRLYWGDLVDTAIVYREYEDGTESFDKDLIRNKFLLTEVVYIDTPSEGIQVSFANAMNTLNGGPYVDTAFTVFSKKALEELKKDAKLTVREIKKHTSLLLNCFVENPEYEGQMKERLGSPNIKLKLPDKFFEPIKSWKLIQCLYAEIEAKNLLKLKASDGKRKRIMSGKFIDANMVTKEPNKCVLHITEGDSAAGLPTMRMAFLGGHDYNAVFCLSGKIPNAMKASIKTIEECEEFASLKQALNLHEGLDYTQEKNRRTLKYGLISIETDADDDGKHICALMLCYFNRFYPSLFKIGIICYLYLPVIKVFDDREVVERFYSPAEYQNYVRVNGNFPRSYDVHYYKGLASYEEDEVEEDVEVTPSVYIIYDDQAQDSFETAFHKDKADERKTWISVYRQLLGNFNYKKISFIKWEQEVTSYINNQMIDYSLANLVRSLPHYHDGLKGVQRKILYAALLKNNWKETGRLKVSVFGGFVTDKTCYHHGNVSLEAAIMKMAQNFVGSNNLPLLTARSQLGKRKDGGAKSTPAGRYAYVELSSYTPYLCPKELVEIIPRKMDENEEIEPSEIICIIPVMFLNRVIGIATGHSTSTPCYHPRDLINWVRTRCDGNEPEPLFPYFHGFRGTVKIDRVNIEEEDDIEGEEEIVDQEIKDVIPTPKSSTEKRVVTIGEWKIEYKGRIGNLRKIVTITELPVGRWTDNYYKMLVEKNTNKKLLFDEIYNRTNEKTEEPKIVLDGWTSPKTVNDKNLFLVKSFSLMNITVVDENGFPRKCTVRQILEEYYNYMIGIFTEYQIRELRRIEEKIIKAENELRFTRLVINKDIPISNDDGKPRKKSEMIEDMEKFEITNPEKTLAAVKIINLTVEKMEEFKRLIKKLRDEYEEFEKITPQEIWKEYLDKLEKKLPY